MRHSEGRVILAKGITSAKALWWVKHALWSGKVASGTQLELEPGSPADKL